MKTMIFSPTTTTTTFHHRSSPATPSHLPPHLLPSTGSVVLKGPNFQCKAVSKSRTQEYLDVLQQNDLPFINWQNDIVDDDVDTDKISYSSDEIKGFVEKIKGMLDSMDDGEITVSAYDTAWVALVQDVNGSGRPQFPSSLEWIVNNQLPDGSWGDHLIFLAHDRIINTIPKDIMQKVPTTLLHSLEGMQDLDWEKLVKLQCKDGSFLFSPSSTAFALVQTKDEKCLQYLTHAVTKFNGGVPNVYPVDLFEHIWVVDRLQRLGISRYFKSEIEDCVEYIHRYWTKDGICWAKNSNVQDIDDTAMGFRLLRMHGYEISPDVFRQFEKDGKFVCFAGQSTQAVTGMFNLFRASQMVFPGEKILEDAKKFSYNYLKEKQSTNELLDKWIIAKDLPGEVGFALDVPWYASLPRLETRWYLEQYGGEDDVWIGKTLYRMGNVSNNTYLEMAKIDYNNCLTMHQREWNTMKQWYVDFNIGRFGMTNITSLLVSYYLAAASVFEPERSKERIAWAKTTTLVDTISSFFDSQQLSNEHRRDFVDEFRNTLSSLHPAKYGKPWHGLMVALQGTLQELALDALMWEMWLTRWQEGADAVEGQAELIVQTMNMIAGRWTSKELFAIPQYRQLSTITDNLCVETSRSGNSKENRGTCFNSETANAKRESRMQELVQLVLNNSPDDDDDDDLDQDLKQTFLSVAKTFYYKTYFDPETINVHISKVLFENVI
ncbi:hypothetical protein L6452_38221 [Arctium lappa]|uniref:Uncharacterized protein n=1 Tax=Arctium lappa TaxID=4217 RepID=A0ACB8Y554_ARCLA|nr:hypothetical protein L6452_38221 [Arctium lappa]